MFDPSEANGGKSISDTAGEVGIGQVCEVLSHPIWAAVPSVWTTVT